MRCFNFFYIILLSLHVMLLGCASMVGLEAEKERDPNYVLDRTIIQKADEELLAGDLKRAEELYLSIIDQKQKSRFFLYANYGLAKVYFQQTRLDQSNNILSDVIAGSRVGLPDLALKSLILQASIFEEKKDHSRALLCLLDAEKIAAEDELFTSLFIVPLRLALIYEKLREVEKSKVYFHQVRLNFQKIEIPSDVIEKKNLTRKVFELYEQSIEKFKDENMLFDVQLYRHQLQFMIFVLQMDEPLYSSKVAEIFETKNLKLRESILEFYVKRELDVEAKQRDLFERQYNAFLLYQTEINSLFNELNLLSSKSTAVVKVLDTIDRLNLQLRLDLEMRRPFNPKAEKDFSDTKEGGSND